MSFFRKLKDRLTKSSSKLEAGLEAIVEEAAEETPGTAPASDEGAAAGTGAAREGAAAQGVTATAADVTADDGEPGGAPSEYAPSEPAPGAAAGGREGGAGAEPAPEAPRAGLLARLLGRAERQAAPRRVLDDEMLEEIEDLLVSADMGVETAARVVANLAEGRMGRRLSVDEVKALLAAEIARIMEPVARPLPLFPERPQVVLVVGVNGSGKTTTIGKLAAQFRAAGKSVMIAAGDTFRAAAVEQLQVWG
ncbi:MAG: signal recognition particle-docking protein FtsY, partial [Alphaproteobacteria bacterium]